MSSIELTSSQKTVLTVLVNLFREQEDAVKGEDIAEEVGRNPGTIRNQMQSLKALQLVEGVPGPKGGYKPTASAFQALDVERIDQPATVQVHRNGDRLEDLNVEEIDLTTVHHPDLCRAKIHILGSLNEFHEGDNVTVGPTPLSDLVIEGVVDGRDETDNIIILQIKDLRAPVEDPVN